MLVKNTTIYLIFIKKSPVDLKWHGLYVQLTFGVLSCPFAHRMEEGILLKTFSVPRYLNDFNLAIQNSL